MFAANTYRIRPATDDDAEQLRSLAERNSQDPLTGRILIGELDGTEAAAISLSDGRLISDDTPRASHLAANLRVRAVSMWAYGNTPALHDRLLSGLPAWYRAVATSASEASEEERELALAQG